MQSPRPMVMWWTRRFGAPLREVYQPDTEVSDQFMDLLEQADRRLGSPARDSEER